MSESIFENDQWAQSHQNRPIALYHSHSLNALASMAPILFVGGVHGDEPEGVFLAEELLKSLSQRKSSPQAWALITCINPDGLCANQRTNGRGVDLNRNFPTSDWKASPLKDRYYSGPQAASENETKALVKLITQIRPQVIIHFHSWKPCVVYTGPPGQRWAEALATPRHPVQAEIGYPTPGSLGQYGWLAHSIPVVCIEESEGAVREEVWSHFGQALLKLTDSKQKDES